MTFEHITQRLVFASSSMGISEAAQANHVIAITGALSSGVAEETMTLVPLDTGRKRRKLVASLLAGAMLTPAGLAAASDNALPGDALYPVKQVTEKIFVLFDQDIVALHRVEELEAAARERRADDQLSERAQAALSQLPSDHPLWGRFHATRSTPEPTDLPMPKPSKTSSTGNQGAGVAPLDDDNSSDSSDDSPVVPWLVSPTDDASSTDDSSSSEDDDASEDAPSADDSSG